MVSERERERERLKKEELKNQTQQLANETDGVDSIDAGSGSTEHRPSPFTVPANKTGHLLDGKAQELRKDSFGSEAAERGKQRDDKMQNANETNDEENMLRIEYRNLNATSETFWLDRKGSTAVTSAGH